ncbi:eap30 subunit of ell complex [Anaeramoeba flamelloides]|uniref:Eap30 subunit of ell complex n=1 Tax=Anaeramoeba flamelloides TaxID=1746091 RepID=A0AAV7ZHL0_9EUKA|nr:eap30 subunit of ell complex [Anaeramoeba flamelloides]KAJ6239988.1 eap30 subunit of ell complex [Anaeramoeba flamelloides]
MRSRGIGITGISRLQVQNNKLNVVGKRLTEQRINDVKIQFRDFKTNLEEFAQKYRKNIRKDPKFRTHFQKMCASIGVDPLASNKGFWAELLGVGNFYSELGVQLINVCGVTRSQNGGLIAMSQLKQGVEKMRGSKAQKISFDDIERAISKLKILGSGFEIIKFGQTKFVKSVPTELNQDHTQVFALAHRKNGVLTKSLILKEFSWQDKRAESALRTLLSQGMAWIDTQPQEHEYWFPSLIENWLEK